MAADANLIRGARDAASGAGKMTMAGGELGRTAQGLIGRVDARTADLRKRTEEAKERGRKKDEKFDENTEAALQQGGALGEAEYEFTRRKVDNLQQEYQKCAWHDDACKKRVMMSLSKESQGLTSMKDTRDLNAKALLNLRGDVSREQQEVMGIYANSRSGKYDIVEGEDGEIKYTFDLGEGKKASYTKNELDKMFEAQKDSVGMEETKKRGIANLERGKTGEAYSEEQEGAAFDSLTKTDNSLRSYLNDEWLGGENFSGSMDSKIKSDIEALKNDPYVAIVDSNIQNLDIPIGKDDKTNWYDNITEEDTALIKQKLMNPQTDEEEKISREVAKQHYIDAQRQQHAKGVKEAENAALAETGKTLDKFKMEKHKAILRMMVDNNASQNDIDEYINKVMTDSSVDVTTSTEVIVPDNFDIDSVDGESKVTINKNTALKIYDQLQSTKSQFIFGSQGTYFKREDKVDNEGNIIEKGGYEIFKGVDNEGNIIEKGGSRDQIKAQLRKENPYLDKIMNESTSTSLEDAIKQYNSMEEREDRFRNMGGDGISREEIEAREGTTEARRTDSKYKSTSKTFTGEKPSNAKETDVLSWLANNLNDPSYQTVLDIYNSSK